MSVERQGVVTLGGKPITLIGTEIKVGDQAPDFTLISNDLTEISSDKFKGKPTLVSTILSFSTSICDVEIKRFNEEAGKLGDKVNFITVSADLPFTQTNWCAGANVENVQSFSDHKDMNFAQAFGTLVKELRTHCRAIFVLDAGGKVQYVEYVSEIGEYPDYDNALEAIQKVAN